MDANKQRMAKWQCQHSGSFSQENYLPENYGEGRFSFACYPSRALGWQASARPAQNAPAVPPPPSARPKRKKPGVLNRRAFIA
jgi:hypothetical protein